MSIVHLKNIGSWRKAKYIRENIKDPLNKVKSDQGITSI